MIRRIFSALADIVADIVAPATCPVCGSAMLPGERALCTRCLAMLPRIAPQVRSAGLKPYVSNGIAPPGFCAAWFVYNPASPHAELIRRAKYADRPRLASELGRLFADELAKSIADADEPDDFVSLDAPVEPSLADLDALLPVPMHWSKRLRRGFNQSVEIARGISAATGIPVADNLVAVRAHATQTRKGNAARHSNIHATITVEYPHELDGLHIAIVDDIVTSGATATECVRAISTSGARPASIGLLALGHTIH